MTIRRLKITYVTHTMFFNQIVLVKIVFLYQAEEGSNGKNIL